MSIDTSPPRALPQGEQLRSRLTGTLWLPGDTEWDAVSASWNLTVRERPAAVVHAATPDDVVVAVRHAAEHGIPVSMQGSGHGASDTLDGTLLIRSGGLRRLEVSPDARTAIVGAGVTWGELQAALEGLGLTGLVGSNPGITVVGLLLQGGYSWFSRQFGAAAGSLRSAEIVDAEGRRRWIDDSSEPELMWGLRGGGGRFAAVLAVEIDLFPAPALAGGRLMLPGAVAPEVFAAFADATRGCRPDVSVWAGMLHLPDLPLVPEPLRGRSFATIDAVTTAGVDALADVLAPLRAIGPVLHDTVAPRTPAGIGDVCEEPTEPSPALQRGIPIARLTADALGTMLTSATAPGPFGPLNLQLRDVSGAPTLRDGAATSISSTHVVNALAMTPVPLAEEPARGTMDALATALAPVAGDRVLPSFVATWRDLSDAFAPPERDRLTALARRHDPAGLFRAPLRA